MREKNLHDTSTPGQENKPSQVTPPAEAINYRTPDGSYNDLEYPDMGKAGKRFARNFPLEHTFPEKVPALLQPNPRTISRRLMTRTSFKPATTLNLLAAAWIQFMTHDWFSHQNTQDGEPITLVLEEDDTWPERPMAITRTAPDPTRTPADKDLPPTYINQVSHWWDASAIYGSDEETMHELRTHEQGKLKVVNGRLPIDPDTGLVTAGFVDNWWVGLGLLHTAFVLEHNAICDRLRSEYASWSDDRLFHTARLINAALMAKIHTVEWTPGILGHPALQIAMRANWWGLATERVYRLLGRISKSEAISGIPGSPVDHHGAPYALTEEFVSVYRLHPLIPDELAIRSLTTGKTLRTLTFPEMAHTNAPKVISGDVSVTDVLYSFGVSHPGAITLHNYPRFLQDFTMPDGTRIDLAAVDILRDRERGVPRYNKFRELVHRRPVRSFEELTSNKQWAAELREVYEGDIDRVDAMVGMYAEDLPKGFGFSDTAFRIFILMASRRLKSDRFFTADYTPEVYTAAGMEWIDDNNMITVLLRHYPELSRTLRGVKNAFAPWNRVES